MARTISRAELARMAAVSKPAITKRCAKDLAPALIGDRVNLDHPLVLAFLQDRDVKPPAAARAPTKAQKVARESNGAPTSAAPGSKKSTPRPTADLPEFDASEFKFDGSAEELEAIAELLQPFLEKFGTTGGFRDWLVALKEIEVIREKRLGNEETEGGLIERALVRTHVFGRIEACNRRLLGDLPKTLVARVYALASTDTAPELAEEVVRDLISSQLDPMTREVDRAISAK